MKQDFSNTVTLDKLLKFRARLETQEKPLSVIRFYSVSRTTQTDKTQRCNAHPQQLHRLRP